jgi:hypothetical protein
MHVGMLWFDDNPKLALRNKIEKAVIYYRQKYRREPNLCLLHPAMLDGGKSRLELADISGIAGLTVRAYRPVLPGHLWIGIEETR